MTTETRAGETTSVTDEELKSLTDAINLRHGIDFSCYEPLSLKRRVLRVLHKFNFGTIAELWVRILKDRDFIFPFMDEISVGLTAMFRDPQLWVKMRQVLESDCFAGRDRLSIWHAGCSTGEEVFTMGIVLRESRITVPLNVLATDISNQSIEVARKGMYPLLKMTEYEKNYEAYNAYGNLKRHYLLADNAACLDQRLIQDVTFEHHNLITGSFHRKFDIIFCRNVMIYFDNSAKQKIFNQFYNSLNDNGLLVIGFYDAVIPMIDKSKFTPFDLDTKILSKVAGD